MTSNYKTVLITKEGLFFLISEFLINKKIIWPKNQANPYTNWKNVNKKSPKLKKQTKKLRLIFFSLSLGLFSLFTEKNQAKCITKKIGN